MRQGIVLFCRAETESAEFQPALIQALSKGYTVFLAYPEAKSGAALRAVLKQTEARFFPQAARDTLGERLAQAFAFLFIQGFEQVALILGGQEALSEGALSALFSGLTGARLAGPAGSVWLGVDRRRFPEVAFLFDTVNWEQHDARGKAEALLGRLLDEGIEA